MLLIKNCFILPQRWNKMEQDLQVALPTLLFPGRQLERLSAAKEQSQLPGIDIIVSKIHMTA
jgi:hypothetical protein